MIKKKVCLIGAFAVGKTSLVQQYVHSIFSEKYLTTVGVKIDKKNLDVSGIDLQMLIWDIQGEDEFSKIGMKYSKLSLNYIRGSAGLLLVVDGTRRESLDTVLSIKAKVDQVGKQNLPAVMLVNKHDLFAQWEVTEDMIEAVVDTGIPVLKTSAKTSEGVELAFDSIARLMLEPAHG